MAKHLHKYFPIFLTQILCTSLTNWQVGRELKGKTLEEIDAYRKMDEQEAVRKVVAGIQVEAAQRKGIVDTKQIASYGEMWLELANQSFRLGSDGNNIFHLGSLLIDELQKTDLGTIPPEFLCLPYDFFYVHLDNSLNVSINDGVSEFSGFFVKQNPDTSLDFHFVFSNDAARFSSVSEPDPLCYIDGLAAYGVRTIPLNEANDLSDIFSDITCSSLFALSESEQESLRYVFFEDVPGEHKAIWQMERTLLDFAIKVLCYLSADNTDVTLRYPDEAPRRLVDRVLLANRAKEKRKAISRLESHGFRRVNFCGDAIKASRSALNISGVKVSPHYRRGHYRWQPFGAKLSQRRRIFIRPTFIGIKGPDNTTGRIYDVLHRAAS